MPLVPPLFHNPKFLQIWPGGNILGLVFFRREIASGVFGAAQREPGSRREKGMVERSFSAPGQSR
jgi:hypothetical protein